MKEKKFWQKKHWIKETNLSIKDVCERWMKTYRTVPINPDICIIPPRDCFKLKNERDYDGLYFKGSYRRLDD